VDAGKRLVSLARKMLLVVRWPPRPPHSVPAFESYSMTSRFRLIVVADAGGAERRHIGDEAMLEANLEGFRRLIPEVAFTAVSRDPAWIAARYGVDGVAHFGFSPDHSAAAQRGVMLDRLLCDARCGRLENETIDAVARSNGLVLSGGGNLTSTWPDLLYERVALIHLAGIFGKPVVVLGQTIGPRLALDERRLLAETLSTVRFVGLRELPSAALALSLGVPPDRLWYQCDDAMFLEGAPEPSQITDHSGESIVVTIDPQVRAQGEAVYASVVRQLRDLSKTTGAHLILVPHAFGDESPGSLSDLTEARVLVERLDLPRTVIAAGLDARQARRVTGDAALVISTRYHPIIFGLAAGIPAVGIYGEEYCRIKLQGALAHARRERWTLTFDAVARGELLPKALELWRARGELRRELESRREAWAAESRERWDVILRALDPAEPNIPAVNSTMFGRPLQDVAPGLVSALEARRQSWEGEQASVDRLAAQCGDASRYARSLEQELEKEMKPLRSLKRIGLSLRSKVGRRLLGKG
jgi:polysaccharide pyruvyl transferase WcaK-like protein